MDQLKVGEYVFVKAEGIDPLARRRVVKVSDNGAVVVVHILETGEDLVIAASECSLRIPKTASSWRWIQEQPSLRR